jgi:hypothetical protein
MTSFASVLAAGLLVQTPAIGTEDFNVAVFQQEEVQHGWVSAALRLVDYGMSPDNLAEEMAEAGAEGGWPDDGPASTGAETELSRWTGLNIDGLPTIVEASRYRHEDGTMSFDVISITVDISHMAGLPDAPQTPAGILAFFEEEAVSMLGAPVERAEDGSYLRWTNDAVRAEGPDFQTALELYALCRMDMINPAPDEACPTDPSVRMDVRMAHALSQPAEYSLRLRDGAITLRFKSDVARWAQRAQFITINEFAAGR